MKSKLIVLAILTCACAASKVLAYTVTFPTGFSIFAYQVYSNPTAPHADPGNVVFQNANQNGEIDGCLVYKLITNASGCQVGFSNYIFDSTSPTGFSDAGGIPVAGPSYTPGEGIIFNNQVGVPVTVSFTGSS